MSPSETDMTDLRPRVVRLEHDMTDHHHRLSKLEEWRHTSDIADARMEERFKGVETKLNKIDANLSKLVWLCIAGFVGAIITFVVRGGLA